VARDAEDQIRICLSIGYEKNVDGMSLCGVPFTNIVTRALKMQ
jgi:hypothetical protein